MKNKERTTIAAIALLLMATIAAVAYVADRRRIIADPGKKLPAFQSMPARPALDTGSTPRVRNLSLQPGALAVARRLGRRFDPLKRIQSVVVAGVTIGSETRMVRTARTQTDNGELIEINVAGKDGVLQWDSNRGALWGDTRAHGENRDLIERLVFDSPDQFVLAQLRGASYFTIARNVRPTDAGENYSGPLWNVVRVSDPEVDEGKRPLSKWRLYYINTVTGLIDRIESEVDGERTVAEFSGWTDINGERLPTEITWTKQGQRVMHYRLANFSHVAQ